MESEKSQLRSGITAPFNKSLNEALQFSPQMPFNIENTVTPSQVVAVLKGEQGTPGLPAALSAVKDDNNLIMLAVSSISRGKLSAATNVFAVPTVSQNASTFTVPAGHKYILKATEHTSASLVATLGELKSLITVNGILVSLKTTASTVGSKVQFMPTVEIVLSEGDNIRLFTELLAYTSGTITHNIVYQDILI